NWVAGNCSSELLFSGNRQLVAGNCSSELFLLATGNWRWQLLLRAVFSGNRQLVAGNCFESWVRINRNASPHCPELVEGPARSGAERIKPNPYQSFRLRSPGL